MPIFSVIIPTYNAENFIQETIESVLNQTFIDYELIVVDDGSKDNTREILNKYKEKDSRIRVITTPNSGGPTTPTNIGINLSKGKYIAFLDHDDSWLEHKLETLFEQFEKNKDVGFILSNVTVFSDETGDISYSKAKPVNGSLPTKNILSGKYFNTFSALSVKRAVLERIGSLDTNLLVFADYDIIVRMTSFGVPHIFLSEPFVLYRMHAHNTSSLSKSAKKRAEDLERILTKYNKTFMLHKKSLSDVHHAIGRIYLILGNKQKAVRHYKLAVLNNKINLLGYLRLLSSYLGDTHYTFFASIKRKASRNLN